MKTQLHRRWVCRGRCTARLIFILALVALAGLRVGATELYRTNAMGTWADGTWWDGVTNYAQPTSTDNAYIGFLAPGISSATVTVSSGTSPRAYAVWIGRHSGTSGRLDVNDGSDLRVGQLYLGYYGGPAQLNLGTNTVLVVTNYCAIGGNNVLTISNTASVSIYPCEIILGATDSGVGTQVVNQIGGTQQWGGVTLGYQPGTYGIYNLTNGGFLGVPAFRLGFAGGGGTLNISDGCALTCTSFMVAGGASWTYRPTNTVTLTAGTLYVGFANYVDKPGVMVQDGGEAGFPQVAIGRYTGYPYPDNGIYVLSNAASLTASTWLAVRSEQSNSVGLLTGWGSVNAGTLYMSGRIVADGFGADRDLIVSNAAPLSRNESFTIYQPDGTLAGWYAVNKGRLRLKPFAVPAGNSTTNWGEKEGINPPELVNSARIAFSNVTGGTLSISQMATDRSDSCVRAQDKVIGLWEFDTSGGFAFGSGTATVTFRYDDALAAARGLAEEDLRVWTYGGVAWREVAATSDTAANTLTSGPLPSFSLFAVSTEIPSPPPGTIIGIR